ncbi:MAG: ABC transporter permease [Firmicutes bacterium]|nr:ABC transporter permease [Bacillota bacterium]
MNRIVNFAKRNLLEMSRDVLSYIFCIIFPIVMLIIMSVVNSSIPKEAGMTLFRIDNLLGGILIFGLTFVMLFTAIGVAKDRSGSFLIRLFASPMRSEDFAIGYILPMMAVALIQALIAFAASMAIARITNAQLNPVGLLISTIVLFPAALMFTAIGMIVGTLFNEKAAPGICSIFISLGSFVGGIWFDVDGVGGVMQKISRCTPFYYATKAVRASIDLDFGKENYLIPVIIVVVSAVILTVISCLVFRRKMRADLA